MSAAEQQGEENSAASLLIWRPDSDKFRLLATIMLVLFAAYGVTYLAVTASESSQPPFGDAFGLWSWARFLVTHLAPEIYDRATLHVGQVVLGMDPATSFPFAYPPTFLLVLWPLGHLPFGIAAAVLILLTLPLYLWATAGASRRSAMWLAALLAPTTTIAVIAGQSSFLSAALLIGGMRLSERRPFVAGVLLGLSSYKPQFGLLLPVALVSARQWRTIRAASATVFALMAVTSVLFGAAIWPAWLATLPGYSQQFAAESSEILHLMPTVLASLLQAGASPSAARVVQIVVMMAMAGVVRWSFRAGMSELAIAALLTAAFLATPYAFVYDMPLIATAVLWLIADRARSGDGFSTLEMLILVIVAVAPITMPSGAAHFPIGVTSLGLLLATILHRLWRVRRRGAVSLAAAAA